MSEPRREVELTANDTVWLQSPWPAAFELIRVLPARSWTLVGGLMVSLHGQIAGLPQTRTTTDVDTALHLETGVVTFSQVAWELETKPFRLFCQASKEPWSSHNRQVQSLARENLALLMSPQERK